MEFALDNVSKDLRFRMANYDLHRSAGRFVDTLRAALLRRFGVVRGERSGGLGQWVL
jgi:hypothetical protein